MCGANSGKRRLKECGRKGKRGLSERKRRQLEESLFVRGAGREIRAAYITKADEGGGSAESIDQKKHFRRDRGTKRKLTGRYFF